MMAVARGCLEVAVVSCMLGVHGRPAMAQSRSSSGAVHEYVAAVSTAADFALPSNLRTTPPYRQILQSMVRLSPTFRRQCVRIAGEPRLTILLHPATALWTRGARALTNIARQPDGAMGATIGIGPQQDEVELIAHELEHVIEQLDRVDLASLAALADTGVRLIDPDRFTFETTRATRVGLTVAQEVRAAGRRAD